jgi:hypothetical protein
VAAAVRQGSHAEPTFVTALTGGDLGMVFVGGNLALDFVAR